LVNFLKNCGYIKNTDKISQDLNSEDVTMKGIIAAQINECNPFILTEMIANKVFNGLTTEEIIGLLGIFIEDVKSSDRIEHFDIKCTTEVKNRISKIHDIINNFINEEKKLGIDYHLYDYWNICYDYVDVGYQWASGCDINKIFQLVDVYEGNFIRSMLKINSIANDLASLCHIYGDMTIVPQLEEVEEKIVRDIINVSSLYLA
jgi:antiviral helicase SKI2